MAISYLKSPVKQTKKADHHILSIHMGPNMHYHSKREEREHREEILDKSKTKTQ